MNRNWWENLYLGVRPYQEILMRRDNLTTGVSTWSYGLWKDQKFLMDIYIHDDNNDENFITIEYTAGIFRVPRSAFHSLFDLIYYLDQEALEDAI